VKGFAAVALVAVVALLTSGYAAQAAQTIEIGVHYSHFLPSAVTVHVGAPVTFVLTNNDPIDHEWIVGDDRVHAIHRTGTELIHGDRPTEVTLPALTTKTTTVTFNTVGQFKYICHLPGHEAYGMVGVVTVVP
jgi:uncharacterized cupredoxin-like copper-binding protein